MHIFFAVDLNEQFCEHQHQEHNVSYNLSQSGSQKSVNIPVFGNFSHLCAFSGVFKNGIESICLISVGEQIRFLSIHGAANPSSLQRLTIFKLCILFSQTSNLPKA